MLQNSLQSSTSIQMNTLLKSNLLQVSISTKIVFLNYSTSKAGIGIQIQMKMKTQTQTQKTIKTPILTLINPHQVQQYDSAFLIYPRANAHIPLTFPSFLVTGRTLSDQPGSLSLVPKSELHILFKSRLLPTVIVVGLQK